jgi:hypothetical protein
MSTHLDIIVMWRKLDITVMCRKLHMCRKLDIKVRHEVIN